MPLIYPDAATPQEVAKKTLQEMLHGFTDIAQWTLPLSHAARGYLKSYKTNFVTCLTSENPDHDAETVDEVCRQLAENFDKTGQDLSVLKSENLRDETKPACFHRISRDLMRDAMREIVASDKPLLTPEIKAPLDLRSAPIF